MSYLAAVTGAALTVMAFPPFGLWPLAVLGPAVWLWGLCRVDRVRGGLAVGFVYGLAFFFGLIWWLSELGWEALVPLVFLQAFYSAAFGGLLAWLGPRLGPSVWWMLASGLWALTEFLRYRMPVGGFEWGALGYALSDTEFARAGAAVIGTSGWTVLAMALAAGLATRPGILGGEWIPVAAPVALACLAAVAGWAVPEGDEGRAVEVAVVQGSTPCPFVHCDNERYLTYLQHLELTRTIPAGAADLVVWSEGSTGSLNADPVNNPEVGEAIGDEIRRIGGWAVVGGDRPVNETHWINANVVFSPEGDIVGEYRKRHPVPFGEYIPNRPWFDWIPALSQVPRDMIPGDEPIVFEMDGLQVGTVISFEGGFARYVRQTAGQGAGIIVVATNEGSYGTTPASDQFIGMTRMRSAETGLDVVHAAVTGRSVVITERGSLGDVTGLGTIELLTAEAVSRPGLFTPYVRWGEWLPVSAMLAAAAVLARSRPRTNRGRESVG